MLRQYLNFRTGLTLLAIAIVTGSIFYSNFLSHKIEEEERKKIQLWVAANKFIATVPQGVDITFASRIQQQNDDIPIIWTNEKDSIIDSRNLELPENEEEFLQNKLEQFKKDHPPIVLMLNDSPYVADKYYYGDSRLLQQIRYFPTVQLLLVALFIILALYAITARNKSTQNQVWAGMAKETAHQLGTPISSLQGWIEMLKEENTAASITTGMARDINRLELISDRFGKIGSKPMLDPHDIVGQVSQMVSYMKRLATDKVKFTIQSREDKIEVPISAPLFDWVIENLIKNALDALEGKGAIDIRIFKKATQAFIDITDNGKGVSKQHLSRIFKPGFSTKKRGWGLGLSLCKRIIVQYHGGELYVKHTESGKGTTFRIILKTGETK